MAVKIGHASIDENGKIAGGSAGDQTGKELCTRSWYNKGWNVLLRPKTTTLAEKSAKACEAACANNKIGYDQNGRNTLHAKAKAVDFDLAKITAKCEADCSSLMHVCAIAGGANLAYGTNGHTTRTMCKAFVVSGDYDALTDSKYLTSDKYLKRGDILVKEGSHTVMVLENGSCTTCEKNPSNLTVDGFWGTGTTKRMQQIFGTTVDGFISNQSYGCVEYLPNCQTSSWKFNSTGKGSQFIKALQKSLKAKGYYTGSIDGLCGKNTVKAIQKWLKAEGLYTGAIDGSMGKNTVKAVQKWANKQ